MYGFRDHLKPIPLTGLRALLQGSSRYSIRMSSPGSIEQTFVQLEDDIQRLTLPLPTGPKHVHCYVAHGTLFDTGLGLGDAPWETVHVQRIAITHFHPDHVGGAEGAARATGAPVAQGGLDYAQCERVWGSDNWPERMAAWFVRHGVPVNVTEDLIVQGHAFAPFIRYAIDPELLYEGSEIEGWQVLELPGHADGHLGFLRDGVLIAGDHLLRRITPAVGLYPESRPDPLGDYLASLERTIELAPRVVYPGHGEPIHDAATRARELIEHHRARLDETTAALSTEPRTAYEISLHVFGRELAPTQRRFAVAETLSHLERLVRERRAARGGDDNRVSYTSP
jgi:glyoxylase-like metal-dependent hydrolase (beta-lactamase superfamily II)